jgi:hypothetical protein
VQLKAQGAPAPAAAAPAPNLTGLPDGLKAGVEALSGFSMDDVRVHRNSPEPAGLGALAFAQGSDIHLGPGQERHLPHEAWHVVQQKQGRVRADTQLKSRGMNVDRDLEREADAMGARALGATAGSNIMSLVRCNPMRSGPGEAPVQRVAYRRHGGAAEDVVDVQTNAGNVTVAGRLGADEVRGSVSLSADQVVRSQVAAGGNPLQVIPALRVAALSAEPRGRRIGQLLTYHHGQAAQARGITYVVARTVSQAAGPFYTPLGFREFLGTPRWQDLMVEKAALEGLLQRIQAGGMPAPPSGEDPGELVARRYVEVVEQLGNFSMFILTDELVANSLTAIQGHWDPQ